MAVLHAYFCRECDSELYDQWEPPTHCGKPMSILFVKVNTPEWGSPRQYVHLRDEPFNSKSELDSWTKARGLELAPSAEKIGGARNEDHLNLGKKYSYAGAPKS